MIRLERFPHRRDEKYITLYMKQHAFGSFKLILNVEFFVFHPEYMESPLREVL